MQNLASRTDREVRSFAENLNLPILEGPFNFIRLLSWAGKRIEPYGVEYILNKLGFSQARITIPKWVQRGAMDPLDKILALVLSHTIAAQRAKDAQPTATASSTTERMSKRKE